MTMNPLSPKLRSIVHQKRGKKESQASYFAERRTPEDAFIVIRQAVLDP
jgi:hypothetical protein